MKIPPAGLDLFSDRQTDGYSEVINNSIIATVVDWSEKLTVALVMGQSVRLSGTSVIVYRTARRSVLQYSHLQVAYWLLRFS